MDSHPLPNPNEQRRGEYRVPDLSPLGQCRSCHAPILWTTTVNKKPIPLSAATIRTDAHGVRWAVNHFSDCPQADQHRQGGYQAVDMEPRSSSDNPKMDPAPGSKVVLRDIRGLPDYLDQHRLVVVGSTVTSAGNCRLIVELQTRKA